MATLLAPYNTAMRLGTGFNSFTQQLCIDNAVMRDAEHIQDIESGDPNREIPQSVTYKSSVIDKVTDVTSAMNINAAFSIKYDTFDAKGKGDFINTSKIKESDVSFLIYVKVVNQVIYDHSLIKFNSISGFQDGGEFTAIISVKGKNKEQSDVIKADAAISFTKDKLDLKADGLFGKNNIDFLNENETTISVSWSGGGQHLKPSDQDWTFETMKATALQFPELVARTPLRTHAILTKYNALRSFHASNLQTSLPYFEKAGVYTNMLLEAYLDYKTIAKNLQILAFDTSCGTQALKPSPAAAATSETSEEAQAKAKQAHNPGEKPVDQQEKDSVISEGEEITIVDEPVSPTVVRPLRIDKPYPATIEGLETARTHCRYMLHRIVHEVDIVSRNPDIATDEKRPLTYMSPFLFKKLIPIGVSTVAPDTTSASATDKSSTDPRLGESWRF